VTGYDGRTDDDRRVTGYDGRTDDDERRATGYGGPTGRPRRPDRRVGSRYAEHTPDDRV
jgi:hypothetical protein